MTRKIQDQGRWLADKLHGLERDIQGLRSSGDLAYSSIEDGSIQEKDLDGNLVASVGKQHDGSHVAVPYTGPKPAAPVAASLKAVPGVVEVRWSGKFIGDAVSAMDFKHVAVHVSATPAVDATPSTQVATIRGELGDVATVTAEEGMLYVVLVAWSTAGKASEPSPVAAVAVPMPADAGQVLEELEEANKRIGQAAKDIIAAGKRLDDEILPAISDAAASPVTDDRLAAGSLTVWPFAHNAIPPGALAPGSVGSGDIADFSIAVTKFKDTRHHLY